MKFIPGYGPAPDNVIEFDPADYPPGALIPVVESTRERYARHGWSDLREALYQAELAARRRRQGRPAGQYTLDNREVVLAAYRVAASENGRQPFWTEVAAELFVDEATLRRARRRLGLMKHADFR